MPAWLSVPKPTISLPAEAIFQSGAIAGNQYHPYFMDNDPDSDNHCALWSPVNPSSFPVNFRVSVESAIEWMYNFCKDVAGEKNGRSSSPLLPLFFCLFLFNALMNLIPGFGSIMVQQNGANAFPLLRGANTDINTALALALISFVFVTY